MLIHHSVLCSDEKTVRQESVTLPYLAVKIPYETEKGAVILLCCAVLCCAVLCCAVLCCAVQAYDRFALLSTLFCVFLKLASAYQYK